MAKSQKIDDVKSQLEQLATQIYVGDIDTAELWGGADVLIAPSRSSKPSGGFYPSPRQVVTANAPQLSWLFFRLRDIFIDFNDGQTKVEFFGRLANAAIRYQKKSGGDEILHDLLAAVLHEAFAIADEIEEGSFHSFAVAGGNEIADDYVDEAERTGFIGIEATRQFFAAKGTSLP